MKTIGLLGGMSWESTAVYYKLINEGIRKELGGLASADILMRSFDFQQVVDLQRSQRWDCATNLLAEAAKGLASAGADCILICTNTMHLVAEDVAKRCDVPLLNIIDATANALKTHRKVRPLLLATRYTMEQGFYAEHMKRQGIEVLIPDAADRAICHSIIFDELCQGIVSETGQDALRKMAGRGQSMGADSIILGCTELGLSISGEDLTLPSFDSTHIHAAASVAFALSNLGCVPVRASAIH